MYGRAYRAAPRSARPLFQLYRSQSFSAAQGIGASIVEVASAAEVSSAVNSGVPPAFVDIPVIPSGTTSMVVDWTLPVIVSGVPTPTAQRLRVALTSQFFGDYPFAYYVMNFTSTQKVIPNLIAGTTYYIVHETYADGQWSESSNELWKQA